MKKVSAIIVAAGKSERMKKSGITEDKMLLQLQGKPVLVHTLRAIAQCKEVNEIIVVTGEETAQKLLPEIQREAFASLVKIVPGGNTRQQSVKNGVEASSEDCEYLLIHDGARPLITLREIQDTLSLAERCQAAAIGVRAVDTFKIADDKNTILQTPDRSHLWAIRTPQIFQKKLYLQALSLAEKEEKSYTDDCQLIEHFGAEVKIAEGAYSNIKLTTAEDIDVASAYFRKRDHKGGFGMKIGHGYDVHRLVNDRKLILGGVEIPYEKGLLGHSDADVLLHAVCDSLLGAAAMGDIGKLFPDNDPKYLNIDSRILLRETVRQIAEQGYEIGNIDATVLAQAPKLKPYILQMRENIAQDCRLALDAVSVKATTEEGLGFTGAGAGIAVHAVCLLEKSWSL